MGLASALSCRNLRCNSWWVTCFPPALATWEAGPRMPGDWGGTSAALKASRLQDFVPTAAHSSPRIRSKGRAMLCSTQLITGAGVSKELHRYTLVGLRTAVGSPEKDRFLNSRNCGQISGRHFFCSVDIYKCLRSCGGANNRCKQHRVEASAAVCPVARKIF